MESIISLSNIPNSTKLMDFQNDFRDIQQHLLAARDLLPTPLTQKGRFASLRAFEYSLKHNSYRGALDALECLAEINDCPDDFYRELQIVTQKIDDEPAIASFSISPLVDHPKTKQIPHKQALPLLSEDERLVIGECLRVAADADFFPDWEYAALFGYGREEFVALMEQWPKVDDTDKKVARMINNTLNHLLGYPHNKMSEWPTYISVSPKQVLLVLQKWRRLKGWDSENTELSYFGGFA